MTLAIGDSYLVLTRPSPQCNTIELHFQFRYAAPQPPRLLQLDSSALWFSAAGAPPAVVPADRRKVEPADVQQALAEQGARVRYNQLRQQIMTLTECSKRTAQMVIAAACQQGCIVQVDGHLRPLLFAAVGWLLASRSARGRARADAQGRCDGAGSEEIGCIGPPTFLIGRGRACLFGQSKQNSPIPLVKLPSGGLGL